MPDSNKLKNESSPYLLQHANNPVHWQAWSKEALNEAIELDKPIILSIGYAACHWCHVMEHESFEDEHVAQRMNENFICIKVDREERPDVDQIYMDAVQAMGLNGGWPLNVFLMPNQKPFYGGTYFPKENWMELLDKVAIAYQKNKDKLSESADNFAKALNAKSSETLHFELSNTFNFDPKIAESAFQKLLQFIDWDNGGTLGAPKFPMPVIGEFLLSYFNNSKQPQALKALEFTLTEMAKGGIYDQVAGGFSRYSVDNEWFAPHFEKMLYDNGQLISLYAKTAVATGKNELAPVVHNTIQFVQRELLDRSGGIYSALDADSEGIEGKFYTWTQDEFDSVGLSNPQLIADYYGISKEGNWEDGRNILFNPLDKESFVKKHDLSVEELNTLLSEANSKLLSARNKRVRPSTDNKILCGWNAMYLIGLCDAYKLDNKPEYKTYASNLYQFLCKHMMEGNKLVRNYMEGKESLPAYLEDYAFSIKALIAYAQMVDDETPLNQARYLTDYVLNHFFDEQENLFFFTDQNSEELIARKKELFDNVIPSSNAIMAENLHWLAILFQKNEWKKLSDKMVYQLTDIMIKEPRYMSQWLSVYNLKAFNSYEIIIHGEQAEEHKKALWKSTKAHNCFCMVNQKSNKLPIFQNKYAIDQQTSFYVCQNAACQQPQHTLKEVLTSLSA